jgi:hypothetical protein
MTVKNNIKYSIRKYKSRLIYILLIYNSTHFKYKIIYNIDIQSMCK